MAGQFWAMQIPPKEMEMLYIMLAKIVGRSCQLDGRCRQYTTYIHTGKTHVVVLNPIGVMKWVCDV